MNKIWNNIIEPILKEINPKNILEIGSNSVNIYELIDYVANNNSYLYSIGSSPEYDFKLLEKNFSNIYKHFNNIELNNLIEMNIDIIIISDIKDSSKLIEYIYLLDTKKDNFPIILFYDTYFNIQGIKPSLNKFTDEKTEIKSEKQKPNFVDEIFSNKNNILNDFEKFVENSKDNPKKLFFYKIDSFNGIGILFSEQNMKNFNDIIFFPNEKSLNKKIEKLKDKLKDKNEKIAENKKTIGSYSKSLSWKITRPLRATNNFIKRIFFNPYLFIVLKSNIHFRTMFQHIKAYKMLKDSNFLFDEKFYKSEYPSTIKFKFPPLIHYMYYGHLEGKIPNSDFSIKYPYDKINNMNPLIYGVIFDENIKNEVEYRKLKTQTNKSFFNRIYKEILFRKNFKISIKVPAKDEKAAFFWGDYHFALSLKKEFEKKNYKTKIDFYKDWNKKDNSDVVLVLRGLFEYKTKPNQINLMWNISHPDLVTAKEYNTYNHVFIASNIFTKKLKKVLNVPVTSLLQCTDKDVFYPNFSEKYQHDLLFVGNSRGVFRQIIKDLFPTKRELGLYGRHWDKFLPKNVLTGNHIPNNELNKAYSSCKILLNDHWEDMVKNGFISNRIFDGLACGSFIISDKIIGSDFLEDSLVVYETPEDLNQLIDYYIDNEDERIKKAKLGKKIVLDNHTFEKRVEQILEVINNLIDS
jgi:spore maturation protein CgeB